uniref:Uncharacterized protein n=1 Tax=Arundo donax TaxID=35708 RepID=A0A0A8ZF83_ARUDO
MFFWCPTNHRVSSMIVPVIQLSCQ